MTKNNVQREVGGRKKKRDYTKEFWGVRQVNEFILDIPAQSRSNWMQTGT
jgi:hypothetical protein